MLTSSTPPQVKREHYIPGPNGMVIHAKVQGNPDTASYGILAIHGINQALQCWEEQDALANPDNVFISMDLPFHGDTKMPGISIPQPDIWHRSIRAVVEYFHVQQIPLFLMGWSFGAWCLKEYLQHYGLHNIGGLILASGPLDFATFLSNIHPDIVAMMTTMSDPSASAMASLEAVQQFVSLLRSQPISVDEQYKTLGYNLIAIQQLQAAGSIFALMETESQEKMKRFYASLQDTPILVIIGNDDAMLPSAALKEAIMSQLPQASTHTIENCGHSSFSEYPDLFNAKVQTFITTSLYKGFP